ncbi:hypothetical protein HanXRQr2_Chr01g0029881 [Helianthus annuus]|uniref:Uncharacterized protein n=1 Tax=Helianthus annuus TaxID=4232 RepID=A0A251VQD1_HELAN|nr:hypothetical protein HanXRQr2_Chr01g0029881 [Helianthus annuus]KAJ0957577.1 hypothetical protein HanPSC8_Chr01g0029131 [Helianthus annuus]
METPINSQSLENLHQNHEYVSIIIAYKLLLINGRIHTPIRFTYFVFSSSIFKSESSGLAKLAW